MRELKMVSNLILQKSQKKLLPYLKKYMIEQSFERKIKREMNPQFNNKKSKVDEITNMIIEL